MSASTLDPRCHLRDFSATDEGWEGYDETLTVDTDPCGVREYTSGTPPTYLGP